MKFKRILSMLLCFVMVLSFFPAGALAAEEEASQEVTEVIPEITGEQSVVESQETDTGDNDTEAVMLNDPAAPGENDVAAVTISGGTPSYHETMEDAVTQALTAGTTPVTIQLLRDYTTTSQLALRDAKDDYTVRDVTVDLNGHVLTNGKASSLFLVNKNGVLTIIDTASSGKADAGSKAVATINSGSTIKIGSGTFTTTGSSLLSGSGTGSFTGGTFSIDPSAYINAECYGVVESTVESTTWYTVEKLPVAKVGETEYTTFADAAAAVGKDGYVELLRNVTGEEYTLSAEETLSVKRNGYTITVNPCAGASLAESTDESGVTTYSNTTHKDVAVVNEICYDTFEDAVAAAGNGTYVIKLSDDFQNGTAYTLSGEDEVLKIDKNGKEITINPMEGFELAEATTETIGDAAVSIYEHKVVAADSEGNHYHSFTGALKAVNVENREDTLTLLEDLESSASTTIAKGVNLTINLNGHMITSTSEANTTKARIFAVSGNLTIQGEGSLIGSAACGTPEDGVSGSVMSVNSTGTLTIANGTIVGRSGKSALYLNVSDGKGGTLNVTGGTVNGGITRYSKTAAVSISGGTFDSQPDESYIAKGYHVEQQADGNYTVAPSFKLAFDKNCDDENATVPDEKYFTYEDGYVEVTVTTLIPTSNQGCFQGWTTDPAGTDVEFLPGDALQVEEAYYDTCFADGTMTLYALWTAGEDIASIGETMYKSLANAVAAANATEDKNTPVEVTLLCDTVERLSVSGNVILNLNGHQLTGMGTGSAITVNEGGILVINGETEGSAVYGEAQTSGGGIENKGTLIINSGTICGYAPKTGGAIYNSGNCTICGEDAVVSGWIENDDGCYGAAIYNKGTLDITAGYVAVFNDADAGIECTKPAIYSNNDSADGSVTVSGKNAWILGELGGKAEKYNITAGWFNFDPTGFVSNSDDVYYFEDEDIWAVSDRPLFTGGEFYTFEEFVAAYSDGDIRKGSVVEIVNNITIDKCTDEFEVEFVYINGTITLQAEGTLKISRYAVVQAGDDCKLSFNELDDDEDIVEWYVEKYCHFTVYNDEVPHARAIYDTDTYFPGEAFAITFEVDEGYVARITVTPDCNGLVCDWYEYGDTACRTNTYEFCDYLDDAQITITSQQAEVGVIDGENTSYYLTIEDAVSDGYTQMTLLKDRTTPYYLTPENSSLTIAKGGFTLDVATLANYCDFSDYTGEDGYTYYNLSEYYFYANYYLTDEDDVAVAVWCNGDRIAADDLEWEYDDTILAAPQWDEDCWAFIFERLGPDGATSTIKVSLKDDLFGREETFTIILAPKETSGINILMKTLVEDPESETGWTEQWWQTSEIFQEKDTAAQTYTLCIDDGSDDENPSPYVKFDAKSSDTKVASIKAQKDGTYLVTVPKNVYGECTLSFTPYINDGRKTVALEPVTVRVKVADYEPKLSTTKITLNTFDGNMWDGSEISYSLNSDWHIPDEWIEDESNADGGYWQCGVTFYQVDSKGNILTDEAGNPIERDDLAAYLYNNLILIYSTRQIAKSFKCSMVIETEQWVWDSEAAEYTTDHREWSYPLTVTVKNSVPKVTAAIYESAALYEADWSSSVYFSYWCDAIELDETTAKSYEITEGIGSDGGSCVVVKPIVDKPVTTLKLKATASGYREPSTVTVKLKTVSKPSLVLEQSKVTYAVEDWEGAGKQQWLSVYDKSTGDYLYTPDFELDQKSIDAGFSISEEDPQVLMIGESILSKAGTKTATIKVTSDEWKEGTSVTLKYTVTVKARKANTYKLEYSTITLNTRYPDIGYGTSIITSLSNMDNSWDYTYKIVPVKNAADYIAVHKISGENAMTVDLKQLENDAVAPNGSYKFNIVISSDGKVVKTLPLTVKVINSVAAVSLKASGKLDVTKVTGGENYISYTVSLKNIPDGSVDAVEVLNKDLTASECFAAAVRENENIVDLSLTGAADPVIGSNKIVLRFHISNGSGEGAEYIVDSAQTVKVSQTAIKLGTYNTTVQVYQAAGTAYAYPGAYINTPYEARIASAELGKLDAATQRALAKAGFRISFTTYNDGWDIEAAIDINDTGALTAGKTYVIPVVVTPQGAVNSKANATFKITIKVGK